MSSTLLTEFTIFSKLSPEIQLIIWRAAIEDELQRDGRIVEVRWSQSTHRYISDCPIPTLLHTCSISRNEARRRLKPLTLAIEVSDSDEHSINIRRLGYADPVEKRGPSVKLFRAYIQLEIDTIYLSHNHYIDLDGGASQHPVKLDEFLVALNRQRPIAEKIKYLAFSGEEFSPSEAGDRLYNMRSLRCVTFVFDDNCCAQKRDQSRHGKLVGFEKLEFPDVSAQLPSQVPRYNQTMQQNAFGWTLPSSTGQPATIPRPSGGLTPLCGLSEEEQHLLKIEALWHHKDDKLVEILDDEVAEKMEETGGLAREEWHDLQTCAVTAIREAPLPKIRKTEPYTDEVGFRVVSGYEGYEITVNGRAVH